MTALISIYGGRAGWYFNKSWEYACKHAAPQNPTRQPNMVACGHATQVLERGEEAPSLHGICVTAERGQRGAAPLSPGVQTESGPLAQLKQPWKQASGHGILRRASVGSPLSGWATAHEQGLSDKMDGSNSSSPSMNVPTNDPLRLFLGRSISAKRRGASPLHVEAIAGAASRAYARRSADSNVLNQTGPVSDSTNGRAMQHPGHASDSLVEGCWDMSPPHLFVPRDMSICMLNGGCPDIDCCDSVARRKFSSSTNTSSNISTLHSTISLRMDSMGSPQNDQAPALASDDNCVGAMARATSGRRRLMESVSFDFATTQQQQQQLAGSDYGPVYFPVAQPWLTDTADIKPTQHQQQHLHQHPAPAGQMQAHFATSAIEAAAAAAVAAIDAETRGEGAERRAGWLQNRAGGEDDVDEGTVAGKFVRGWEFTLGIQKSASSSSIFLSFLR